MLRENKGLTQLDVANSLGVTPAAVSKWENGSSKPRVKVLFRLAEILEVKPKELIAGDYLPEESLDDEAIQRINQRYEYLCKIDSYCTTNVKLCRLFATAIDYLLSFTAMYLFVLMIYKISTSLNVDSGLEAVLCVMGILISLPLFFGLRDLICFGRSLGKRIFGLTIVDKNSGDTASKKQRILRNIPLLCFHLITCFPFVVGIDAIIMLVRGQSVGDSLANTLVIKNKSETNRKQEENKKTEKANEVKTVLSEDAAVKEKRSASVDFKGINAYNPPPRVNSKFILTIALVVVAIIVAVCILIVTYFVKWDSDSIVGTDISKYEEDCVTYNNAKNMMPPLDSLTDYTAIEYSHKTYVYSYFMSFLSNGLALFVQYDESVYNEKKAEVLNSYDFLEEPIFHSGGYQLPLTEFTYGNYRMKIVPDENYSASFACKSFMLIGFDDINNRIVYCYHYDFDIDYISLIDDDPEKTMQIFMDNRFYWIDINSNRESRS